MQNGRRDLEKSRSYSSVCTWEMLCKYGVFALSIRLGLARHYLNGLVQKRRNSIANALELRLSCTNPSTWTLYSHLIAGPVYDRLNLSLSVPADVLAST